MKPWIALVFGILIGWLLGWLFEMWYGRRKRSEQRIELPLPPQDASTTRGADWAATGAVPPVAGVLSDAGFAAVGRGQDAIPAAEAMGSELSQAGVAPHDEHEFEAPPGLDWAEMEAEAERARTGLEPDFDRPAQIGTELPDQKPGVAGPFTLDEEAVAATAPTPDDLLVIEGIGPIYDSKLRAAGITTFGQLAAATPSELADIIQAPAWRKIGYEDWIEQARLLAAHEHEKLRELQERLFRRKKQ